MRTRISGFTLVELLVSFTIVVLLLGLITQIFRSSRTTYDKQLETTEKQQAQLISVSQLSYEIELAGYRGTDDDALDRDFTAPTLEISKGTGTASDSITVRYYEDRWTEDGLPQLKEVTFSVSDDILFRTDLGDPTNPLELIDGVKSLKVDHYLKRNESGPFVVEPSDKREIGGIVINLAFSNKTSVTDDDTTQQLSVGLDNTQLEGSGTSTSADSTLN
jgi:type II secretory pathway component PulJ